MSITPLSSLSPTSIHPLVRKFLSYVCWINLLRKHFRTKARKKVGTNERIYNWILSFPMKGAYSIFSIHKWLNYASNSKLLLRQQLNYFTSLTPAVLVEAPFTSMWKFTIHRKLWFTTPSNAWKDSTQNKMWKWSRNLERKFACCYIGEVEII